MLAIEFHDKPVTKTIFGFINRESEGRNKQF